MVFMNALFEKEQAKALCQLSNVEMRPRGPANDPADRPTNRCGHKGLIKEEVILAFRAA